MLQSVILVQVVKVVLQGRQVRVGSVEPVRLCHPAERLLLLFLLLLFHVAGVELLARELLTLPVNQTSKGRNKRNDLTKELLTEK
jgi:hypothetical protein